MSRDSLKFDQFCSKVKISGVQEVHLVSSLSLSKIKYLSFLSLWDVVGGSSSENILCSKHSIKIVGTFWM